MKVKDLISNLYQVKVLSDNSNYLEIKAYRAMNKTEWEILKNKGFPDTFIRKNREIPKWFSFNPSYIKIIMNPLEEYGTKDHEIAVEYIFLMNKNTELRTYVENGYINFRMSLHMLRKKKVILNFYEKISLDNIPDPFPLATFIINGKIYSLYRKKSVRMFMRKLRWKGIKAKVIVNSESVLKEILYRKYPLLIIEKN